MLISGLKGLKARYPKIIIMKLERGHLTFNSTYILSIWKEKEISMFHIKDVAALLLLPLTLDRFA